MHSSMPHIHTYIIWAKLGHNNFGENKCFWGKQNIGVMYILKLFMSYRAEQNGQYSLTALVS